MTKRKRRPKPEAITATPDDLRAMGEELLKLLETIRSHAASMDELRIEEIKILVGNYHNGVELIRNFFNTQIVNKIVAEAKNRVDLQIIPIEEDE